MHEISGTTADGRSGIRKVPAPGIGLALFACLSHRQAKQQAAPTAPLMACLLGLLLFVQAGSLPMHLGILLLGPDAHAMTEGCDKKTCCTALCYLDKHGIHHCVHEPGDSCECGISTHDLNTNPIFLSAVVTLPELESLIPDLAPSGWIPQLHDPIETRHIAAPAPPPK